MAARKTMNALDFARDYLRKKPDAPFADIRDAAAKKNLVLYPISYGRAQALEGIVKSAPYGSKKKRGKRKRASAAGGTATEAASGMIVKRGPGRPKGSKNKVKRGPGRPPKSARGTGIDNLVETIQNLQNERDEAREVIDQIRGLLARI